MVNIINSPYRLSGKKIVLNLCIEGEPLSAERVKFSKGSAYLPEKTRDYEDLIAWTVKGNYRGETTSSEIFGLRAIFCRSNRQRVDIDNLLKALMDGITKSKVIWEDDSQLREISSSIFIADDKPRVEFIVYRCKDYNPRATCLNCGKELLNSYPSKQTKYCSRVCWSVSRKRVARVCEYCGETFIIAESKAKGHPNRFCSRECLLKFLAEMRKKEGSDKWRCETCGAPVSRKEYKRCFSCRLKSRQPKSNCWAYRILVGKADPRI